MEVQDQPGSERPAWKGREDNEIGERMKVNDSVSTEDLCGEETRGDKEEECCVLVRVPQPATSMGAERQTADMNARLNLPTHFSGSSNAQDVNREASGVQSPHFFSNTRIGRVPSIRDMANRHMRNRRGWRDHTLTPATIIFRARNAKGPSAKRRSA